MIQLNQKRLAKVQDDLTDKNEKLATARGQLAELTSEIEFKDSNLQSLKEQTAEASEDLQNQIRLRLTDSMFAKFTVALKDLINSLSPNDRQAYCERNPFMADVVEQPAKIIQCAMLLYVGYIEGAISFAESAGGGGSTDNDLKWGRDPDEEDRKFAFRCMQQAHRLLKPAPARTVRRGR